MFNTVKKLIEDGMVKESEDGRIETVKSYAEHQRIMMERAAASENSS